MVLSMRKLPSDWIVLKELSPYGNLAVTNVLLCVIETRKYVFGKRESILSSEMRHEYCNRVFAKQPIF